MTGFETFRTQVLGRYVDHLHVVWEGGMAGLYDQLTAKVAARLEKKTGLAVSNDWVRDAVKVWLTYSAELVEADNAIEIVVTDPIPVPEVAIPSGFDVLVVVAAIEEELAALGKRIVVARVVGAEAGFVVFEGRVAPAEEHVMCSQEVMTRCKNAETVSPAGVESVKIIPLPRGMLFARLAVTVEEWAGMIEAASSTEALPTAKRISTWLENEGWEPDRGDTPETGA